MKMRKMFLLALIILLILPMAGCDYEGSGDKLYKQGKYSWAADAYKKALDKELEKPYGAPEVLYFKLGACYEMMRDPGTACDYYMMVIKTNPLGKLSLDAGKALIRCKAQQFIGNPPNVGGGNNIPDSNGIFDRIGDAISGVLGGAKDTVDDVIGGSSTNAGSGDAAKIRQKIQALQADYNKYIDRGDLVKAQKVFKEIQVLQDQLKRL